MSFSSCVRREIVSSLTDKIISPEHSLVVLAALCLVAGEDADPQDIIRLRLAGEDTVRLAEQAVFKLGGEIRTIVTGKRDTRFDFCLAKQMPVGISLLIDFDFVSYIKKQEAEDYKYILGPFFVGAGFLSDPEKQNYLLAFKPVNEKNLVKLERVLLALDFEMRRTLHQGKEQVYLSHGEGVSRFLLFSGAHRALLRFEAMRAERELAATVNRQFNCDNANMGRLADAVVRQLEAIAIIEQEKGLQNLPEALQEAARLRLRYPEYSLSELATCVEPQISKSGMSHRLSKLVQLAWELKRD